jgi:hypothetical protein
MNIPNGPGTPRRSPRPEVEAKLFRESINLPVGRSVPGKKTSSSWLPWDTMRKTRTDQSPFYWTPQEPMVQMKIGNHLINFMVSAEADNSIVTQPVGPLSQKHATIIEATRNEAHHSFLVSRKCNLGSHEGMNSFISLIAQWA